VFFGRANVFSGRQPVIAAVSFCQPATLSLKVDRLVDRLVDWRVVRLGLGRQPCRHDGSLVQHGLVASSFPGGDLRSG
jgi:hypothetical protein